MAFIFIKDTPCTVIKTDPMPGNDIAPPLTMGGVYKLQAVHICKCGEVHFDVGRVSKFNFITCYKCGEELPDGKKIHWAHSSRFEINT